MKGIDCSKSEELIVRRMDEGLSLHVAEELEHHLQSCLPCQAVFRSTADLMHTLKRGAPKEPDEAFWKRYDSTLEARLREKEDPKPRPWMWKTAGAFLVAGAVLIAVALGTREQAQQTSGHKTVPFAIMQDLAEIYGPTPWEVSASEGEASEWFAMAYTMTTSDDTGPFWFDVEEDPYQLELFDYQIEPTRESGRFRDRKTRIAGSPDGKAPLVNPTRKSCGYASGTSAVC